MQGVGCTTEPANNISFYLVTDSVRDQPLRIVRILYDSSDCKNVNFTFLLKYFFFFLAVFRFCNIINSFEIVGFLFLLKKKLFYVTVMVVLGFIFGFNFGKYLLIENNVASILI